MTEPYDPYRPSPNDPFGQPGQPYGGQYGQPQYGPQARYGQQFPYGQPQPGQQPYGQPAYGPPAYGQPYQGSYGQPAGWGAGGPRQPPPPQPPKRKSGTPLVVTAVLAVLLLIGGGVAAAVALRGDGSAAQPPGATSATGSSQPSTGSSPTTGEDSDDFEVNQCATLTPEDGGRATVRLTGCGGLLSDVVIAKIASSECPEPYLSFNPGAGKFYCLAMDAEEGDCFRLDNLIKRAIACDGEETRKVVKIFDGVADDSKCGAVPQTVAVYAYPDPPMTLCLGRA